MQLEIQRVLVSLGMKKEFWNQNDDRNDETKPMLASPPVAPGCQCWLRHAAGYAARHPTSLGVKSRILEPK